MCSVQVELIGGEEGPSVRHTPGPWRADVEQGFVIVSGSGVYSVRDAASDEPTWCGEDLTLMASAPHLLAACRHLLSVVTDPELDAIDDEFHGRLDRAVQEARDAVARAEGINGEARFMD